MRTFCDIIDKELIWWLSDRISKGWDAINPFNSDRYMKVCAGLSVVILIVLVLASGFMFHKTVMTDYAHNDIDTLLVSYLKSSSKLDEEIESAIKGGHISVKEKEEIVATQKLILARQTELVDDYRQETNNLINKMNGWLGFWIGIIAIIGVFFPLALQYKSGQEAKEQEAKLDDKLQGWSKEFNDQKGKLSSEINRMQNDYMSFRNEKDKEIKDCIDNQSQNVRYLDFLTKTRILSTIMEAPEALDSIIRNKIYDTTWKEILQGLKDCLEEYFDQDRAPQVSYRLSLALMMISSNLGTIRRSSLMYSKMVNPVMKQLRDVVDGLNNPMKDRKTMEVMLNRLLWALEKLDFR